MSNATPMGLERRLAAYNPQATGEHDLTPRQRRRAWRKAHRNGERGSESEVLYERKGRPTPRRADARGWAVQTRRFLEVRRGR